MKILIMSDIHANWYATEAILARESYDALIFLGDVVDFGPDPRKCIDFLMESARMRFWGVRGEHDHAMAFGIGASPGGEVGFLRRLPLEERISLDGMDFELAHRPDPETLPILERGKERTDPVSCRKFILVGHSHKPYIRSFGDTAVLNPGSVGQPRDNDPRASYAVIEDGEASIRRVKYDIEKTVKGLERSRMPYEVKGRLISMLLSGAAAS